ncbi:MAG: DUF1553 domain-containing protein [Planctomycetaceae bacterium]|nr:DUF1553 domain-containing protein [Planctomycetaceae bacterium]MBT6484802.1 DUF1553 domain-containing protein [Planctomycetaceae bacterium]MBT6497973.1 DUF1553 domain-containing protein [Planctomycetaceae bacterium]
MKPVFIALFFSAALLASVSHARAERDAAPFGKSVAPILIKNCLGCHNPTDPKGTLDLSQKKAMLKGGDSGPAVVPGKPDESYIIERVADGSMPPEGKGKRLTKTEIDTLARWIKAGMSWPKGRVLSALELTTDKRAGVDWWSLQSIVQPAIPQVENSEWPETPIDAFVLSKLEERGLQPAQPATKRTLIRRATLDLLGLPPTPTEIDRFLADDRPNAYRRLIDRLLASPRYGERWGRHWLDVVRYTESDGFEHDKFRPHAWRYRDYVIDSFNADKPYNRFVTEQLAGDVLQPVTRGGLIATGFLVAGPWDEVQYVAASQAERKRAHEEQMAEILATISQSFFAMTVDCARCHDHKFDPFPQADYYSMKAVFDGVDHSQGRTVGNRSILTAAEKKQHAAAIAPINQRIKQLQSQIAVIENQLPQPATLADVKRLSDSLVPGKFGKALNTKVNTASLASQGVFHTPPFTVECFAKLNSKADFNVLVANNLKSSAAHWEIYSFAGEGDFSAYLPGYKPNTVRSGVNITDGKFHYLAMQFDGKQLRLYVDAKLVKEATLLKQAGTEDVGQLYLGGYPPHKIGCDGVLDEVRISRGIRPIDGIPPGPWTADENTLGLWRFDKINHNQFANFVPSQSGKNAKQLDTERQVLNEQLQVTQQELKSHTIPLAYIGYRNQPPPTHLLLRGDLKTPGPEVVATGFSNITTPNPQFGLSSKSPEGSRRLKFAEWATSPEHPLTARVIVNRIWQYHFGKGLVKTPSDFGFNGGLPSHPELLDWLATDFVRHGWSIKHLHRRIMQSAAYRQSSAINQRAAELDPDNRFLWKFSPRRLEGETVRDVLLAVSGELNHQIGGPSFQPFTVTVFNTHFYHLFDSEKSQYNRRTVYRANVMTGRSPLLDAFDCPAPSISAPKRASTTTPQQALALMNDSFVLRQAERLATRTQETVGGDANKQVQQIYQRALGRTPTRSEATDMVTLVKQHGLKTACWVLMNSSEFLYLK